MCRPLSIYVYVIGWDGQNANGTNNRNKNQVQTGNTVMGHQIPPANLVRRVCLVKSKNNE